MFEGSRDMGVSGPKKWPNMKFTGAISLLPVGGGFIFFFSPRKLEEDESNLTVRIFFKGVGEPTNHQPDRSMRSMSGSIWAATYNWQVATPTFRSWCKRKRANDLF